MAIKIIASEEFKIDLSATYTYLKQEWSEKVADEFLNKIEKAIDRLSKFPSSGPSCRKKKDVRKLTITKHNKIYYKIKKNTIHILALADTRQHPNKNKYD